MLGIGGAPTRNTTLPLTAAERKQYPVASGCLDYFPDALAEIAHLSYIGNEQHNKGQPLHWARGKSGDEADTMLRHFLQRGTLDSDGVRHSVKMAWRALALLQKELEAETKPAPSAEPAYPVQPMFLYWEYNHTIYRYRAGAPEGDCGEFWDHDDRAWLREASPAARTFPSDEAIQLPEEVALKLAV